MATLLGIDTPRLSLVAGTAAMARADVADRRLFAALLAADVPDAWPPEVLRDVQELFAAQLESGKAVPGWWHWYALLPQGAGRVLIGTGGFAGAPDDVGTITLGYSMLDAYAGRGYASEMVAGLITWAAAAGPVARVHATTFERHVASVRVLEKNRFICKGLSSEDAAADGDRRGRGRLMLFVRGIAAV